MTMTTTGAMARSLHGARLGRNKEQTISPQEIKAGTLLLLKETLNCAPSQPENCAGFREGFAGLRAGPQRRQDSAGGSRTSAGREGLLSTQNIPFSFPATPTRPQG